MRAGLLAVTQVSNVGVLFRQRERGLDFGVEHASKQLDTFETNCVQVVENQYFPAPTVFCGSIPASHNLGYSSAKNGAIGVYTLVKRLPPKKHSNYYYDPFQLLIRASLELNCGGISTIDVWNNLLIAAGTDGSLSLVKLDGLHPPLEGELPDLGEITWKTQAHLKKEQATCTYPFKCSNNASKFLQSQIVSVGCDGQVKLWDLQQGQNLAAFRTNKPLVDVIKLENQMQTVVTSSLDEISLWDLRTSRPVASACYPDDEASRAERKGAPRNEFGGLFQISDHHVLAVSGFHTNFQRTSWDIRKLDKPFQSILAMEGHYHEHSCANSAYFNRQGGITVDSGGGHSILWSVDNGLITPESRAYFEGSGVIGVHANEDWSFGAFAVHNCGGNWLSDASAAAWALPDKHQLTTLPSFKPDSKKVSCVAM